MFIALACILFTVGVIIAAAITDFLKLRIPNIIPIVTVVMFAMVWILDQMMDLSIFDQPIKDHLLSGALIFGVMLTLYVMRLFGGGDAKLIPAVCLWIGMQGLPVFLLATTIAGGCLALMSIVLRKTGFGNLIVTKLIHYQSLQDGWIGALARGENAVPYGIAIAIGTVIGFRDIGLLP